MPPATTTTPNLTVKQLQVLRLIQDFRRANGYSPSLRELGSALGVCQVTVKEHIDALVKKGVLLREAKSARAIRPAGEDQTCPLCGHKSTSSGEKQ